MPYFLSILLNHKAMKYQDYTFLDFLQDDYFKQWVLKPDTESDLFWNSWLEMDHPNKQKMLKAKKIIKGIGYQNYHKIDKADVNHLHENIIRFNQFHRLENYDLNRDMKPAYWIAAAVSAILVISAAIFIQFNVDDAPLVPSITYNTSETIPGVKQTIKLPDGTLVKLNAESVIRYPSEFSADRRVVELTGEAFFEVEEDTSRPFIIESAGFSTRVLGTSFNIQTYPGEQQKVAVVTGLVQVTTTTGATALINPDQMLAIDRETSNFQFLEFDYAQEIGWKDGILRFEDQPLEDVFRKLERWYGVEISCQNAELLDDTYKGEFKNESLDNVLKGIGYTSDYSFEEEEGVYLIY